MLGKIFGAGLGWLLGGGPIGMIIGIAIGGAFDKGGSNIFKDENSGKKRVTQRGDFSAALIVVSAAVMKADGRILKSELDFVKKYFIQNFGPEVAKEKIQVLGEVLKQDIPVDDVARQIRTSMRVAEKRLLLQYLFGIAKSDGEIDVSELYVIERICRGMGLSNMEFLSMKAMYTQNYGSGSRNTRGSSGGKTRRRRVSLNSSYSVLGISANADDKELKKAYRKLAVKFHPDKVAHLGKDHVEVAEDKFQKLQEAYETIKKSRGLN
jgi:DnaJ like chaperone protein